MKVYLSMSMTGVTEDDYKEAKEKAYAFLVETLGRVDIEIIDSFIPDAFPKEERIYNLGKSISMMNNADLVLFMPGWSQRRGCIIENEVAQQYCIPTLVY